MLSIPLKNETSINICFNNSFYEVQESQVVGDQALEFTTDGSDIT